MSKTVRYNEENSNTFGGKNKKEVSFSRPVHYDPNVTAMFSNHLALKFFGRGKNLKKAA